MISIAREKRRSVDARRREFAEGSCLGDVVRDGDMVRRRKSLRRSKKCFRETEKELCEEWKVRRRTVARMVSRRRVMSRESLAMRMSSMLVRSEKKIVLERFLTGRNGERKEH